MKTNKNGSLNKKLYRLKIYTNNAYLKSLTKDQSIKQLKNNLLKLGASGHIGWQVNGIVAHV